MKIFLGSLVISILLIPSAYALGAEGLVTCDGVSAAGESCNFCSFVEMMERVINFIVAILVIISVIMLAVTGIQMAYTAAGNGDALALLKSRLTNIVLGFLLILASWTIVDVLIKALVVDEDIKNWRTFISSSPSEFCFNQLEPIPKETSLDEVGGVVMTAFGPAPTGDPLQALGGLSDAQAKALARSAGLEIKDGVSLAGVRPHVLNEAAKLNEACGCNIMIASGTDGNHSTNGNFTHGKGFKLDFRTRDNPELLNYVRNLPSAGSWRNGTPLYYDSRSCGTYAIEGDHIDVVYKTGC